jgi:hypothetical protein
MADPNRTDLMDALRAADAAGDTAAAEAIARRISTLMPTGVGNVLKPQVDQDAERAKAFVETLGPVEGAVTAFGEAARRPITNAARRVFPQTMGADDAVSAEEMKNLKPLFERFPKAAALGGMSVKMPVAVVAGGPRSVLQQSLAAGTEGALTAEPGAALESAAGAAGGTLAIGGALKLLGKFGAGGIDRANRQSLKIMRPDAQTTAKAEYDFGSWEAIGQKIHDLGLDKPGMDLRQRRALLQDLGEKAGVDIKMALNETEARGGVIDVPALVDRMRAAGNRYITQPGQHRLTDTLRSAESDAERQLIDFEAQPEVATGSVKAVESAKRALQDEGFLSSTKKYPNPADARRDPGAAWYKAAARPVKEAVEAEVERVGGPDLLAKFLRGKDASGVAHVFEEPLTRAANTGLTAGSGVGTLPTHFGSPRYAAFNAVTEPVMSHVLPYAQITNRAAGKAWEALPNALPWDKAATASRGAAPTTTQILVELLRGAL